MFGLVPIGPGSGCTKLQRGSFLGLDVLHPESPYPVIVTARKGYDCYLLELRG